jgi:hypothetical protein
MSDCTITDCTIPADGDLCEAHGGSVDTIERQRYHVNFLDASSADGEHELAVDRWEVEYDHLANAISSEIVGSSLHAPVLDIDFEARLVPSSTPGHYHLYLDRAVAWPAYEKVLRALAEAGLQEEGYVSASIDRRATFVRKPGVVK